MARVSFDSVRLPPRNSIYFNANASGGAEVAQREDVFAMVIIGHGLSASNQFREGVTDAVNRYFDACRKSKPHSEEKDKKIAELRTENEGPPLISARSCGVCLADHPRCRAVLVACGHTLCMACALQMEDVVQCLQCPFCRKSTSFVKLHEEISVERPEKEKLPESNVEDNEKKVEKAEEKSISTRPSSHPISTSFCTVYVGNLPYQTAAVDVGLLFGTVGMVCEVRLVRDRLTGRPTGFGFVRFDDEAGARRAVERLNDYVCNCRKIRVRMTI